MARRAKTLEELNLSGYVRSDKAALNPPAEVRHPILSAELAEKKDLEVPKWMKNPFAIDEWKRLAPLLIHDDLLTKASLNTFGMMCAVHGLVNEQLFNNQQPTMALFNQARMYSVEFGLTAFVGKAEAIKRQRGAVEEPDDRKQQQEEKPKAKSTSRFSSNSKESKMAT